MEHKSCPRCGAAFICQLKKPVTKILYKANAPLRARLVCIKLKCYSYLLTNNPLAT